MSLEERVFNICLWFIAAVCLLILLTSCSAAVALPTTPTSEATAMKFTVNKLQNAPPLPHRCAQSKQASQQDTSTCGQVQGLNMR